MTDLRDQLADFDAAARLASIAAQLAARVRDHDPENNGQWLTRQLPDPADWFRLAFVLAAAVPVDQTWRDLTAWARNLPDTATVLPMRPRRPCGTAAAARRHRYHREPLCDICRNAERQRERDRQRARRALTPDRRTG